MRVPVGGKGLWVRLDIDPAAASSCDDRFILFSTDNSYRSEKTVKDDQVPGDKSVDLHYSELAEDKSYTLHVIASAGATPRPVFENVPYKELAGLRNRQPRTGAQPSGAPEAAQGAAPPAAEGVTQAAPPEGGAEHAPAEGGTQARPRALTSADRVAAMREGANKVGRVVAEAAGDVAPPLPPLPPPPAPPH